MLRRAARRGGCGQVRGQGHYCCCYRCCYCYRSHCVAAAHPTALNRLSPKGASPEEAGGRYKRDARCEMRERERAGRCRSKAAERDTWAEIGGQMAAGRAGNVPLAQTRATVRGREQGVPTSASSARGWVQALVGRGSPELWTGKKGPWTAAKPRRSRKLAICSRSARCRHPAIFGRLHHIQSAARQTFASRAVVQARANQRPVDQRKLSRARPVGWTARERDLGWRGPMTGSHAARTRATMPGRVVELLFKWAHRPALKLTVAFS